MAILLLVVGRTPYFKENSYQTIWKNTIKMGKVHCAFFVTD